MGRILRRSLPALFLAILVAAPAVAAPSRASSRMRAIEHRLDIQVKAVTDTVILDSIATIAARSGYVLVDRDADDLRVRLEKPATAAEVSVAGWTFEGTERKRLDFEIVAVEGRKDRLGVVGAITLVQYPGAVGEKSEDRGKTQPDRDELKAILERVRVRFAP